MLTNDTDAWSGLPDTEASSGSCHACGQAASDCCDTCHRWLCGAHTFLRRQAWDQYWADGVDLLCADHAEPQPGWIIDHPKA